MISAQVAVALLLASLALAISGIVLMFRHHWSCGGFLIAAATSGAGAVLAAQVGRPDLGRLFLVVAGTLLLPLAVATYPRPGWRTPVDVVALSALVASAGWALIHWRDTAVLGAVGIVTALLLVGYIWWRIERGSRADRWALSWMSLAVALAGLAVGAAVFVLPSTTSWAVAVIAIGVIGPAMTVGVSRPELLDVRRLLVRGVVVGVAAIVYVAALVSLVALLEIGSGRPPVVGVVALIAALLASGFHPLRVMLRGVIDELIFGRRSDPLRAATRMVGTMSEDPSAALQSIRQGLMVPYAALVVAGSVVAVAGYGAGVGRRHTVPLDLGDGQPTELEIGLRPGDLTLTSADAQALRLVVPLLQQTIRAEAMAAQLQISRTGTVTALQEERRRVRRDLHDELGPRLSAIAWTSDAVRNTVRSDPAAAEALLDKLRAEAGTAIEDVRRLAYAMRPPALDELGLVRALDQAARSLRRRDGQALPVQIQAYDVPDRLTAAVEVATYRIVLEALTNAARHSAGQQAIVRLQRHGGHLAIEVEDDGGTSAPWPAGVGLQSMHERAAELGGTFSAASTPRGGLVRVSLPLTERGDRIGAAPPPRHDRSSPPRRSLGPRQEENRCVD